MKSTLLTAGLSLVTLSLWSQDSTTTGHILYEDIRDISDSRWVQNRPDMPTEIKSKWDTYFTPEYSHCVFHPEEQEEAMNTGGVQVRMMRWEPKDEIYIDFSSLVMTYFKEFMTKEFLIQDTLNMKGWKMTGKQGIVLGYPCMEMKSMVNDTVPVLAWFTPRIPVRTGPLEYVGFPGAVLYVNYNDGERTISAVRVNMGRTQEERPEVPEDGEEVTMDEFETIEREKTEQMRRRWGR